MSKLTIRARVKLPTECNSIRFQIFYIEVIYKRNVMESLIPQLYTEYYNFSWLFCLSFNTGHMLFCAIKVVGTAVSISKQCIS